MFLPAAQFGGGARYNQERLQICTDTNYFSDLVWCSRVLFTADVCQISDMESPQNTGDDLQSVVRNHR